MVLVVDKTTALSQHSNSVDDVGGSDFGFGDDTTSEGCGKDTFENG